MVNEIQTMRTPTEPKHMAGIVYMVNGSQMSTIRLECHDDTKNAHKYYQMSYYDGSHQVDIVYGRLPGYGRSGTARYTTKYCYSDAGARTFMTNKLREKYRKGYTNIGEGDVEESIEETSEPLKNEPIQLSGVLTRIGAM